MIGPDLALQKALRAALVGNLALSALVPAASILDRNERPAPRPSIILGETDMRLTMTYERKLWGVAHTVHVWTREPSTETCKRIVAAIIEAVRGRIDLGVGYHAADLKVELVRVLRDPDGQSAHGVITFAALVQEVAT